MKEPPELRSIAGMLLFVGALIFGIGSFLNFDPLNFVGLALFGAGVVFLGFDGIVSEEIVFLSRIRGISTAFTGLVARAWGAIFVLAGFAILGFAVLSLVRPDFPIGDRVIEFAQTPLGTSLLMMGYGGVGVLYAFSLLFENGERSILSILASVPTRLFGLFVLLTSLGLIGVGILRLVAPQVVESWVQAIFGTPYEIPLE